MVSGEMASKSALTRREVLRAGVGFACAPLLPEIKSPSTRFGLIADVHHGLVSFSERYLEEFVQEAAQRNVDFVVQLGDFCHPNPASRSFLNEWSNFRGPRYGVLGDHDLDYGSKDEAIRWWGIPDRFYSFDSGNSHFIALDANNLFDKGRYVPYEESNFYGDMSRISHVDEEQLDWLVNDLEGTSKPSFVFVHQAIDEIDGGGACLNRHRVRAILEEANRRAGRSKVVACFQGHHHTDQYEKRRGIHYVRINSATHAWLGDRFDKTADYAEPLFCFVTVGKDEIVIEGREGTWVESSPSDRKFPGADRLSPTLSSRRLRFAQ